MNTGYIVTYIDRVQEVLEQTWYEDLHSAIRDALYWKNYPETRRKLSGISIYSLYTENEISFLNM